MKNIPTILGLLLAGMLFSCSEDSLTPSEPQEFYTVPQGNSAYDNDIVDFYKTYNSMFLYQYEAKDFLWNLTSYLGYNFTQPNEAYIPKAYDFLVDECFSLWPKSFLQSVLPSYILLSDGIYVMEQGWDSNWNPIEVEVDIHTGYGLNFVAFGYAGTDIDGLTAAEKREIIGDVNKSLIAYACSRGKLEIPDDFKILSTPSNPGGNYTGPWGYNGQGFLEFREGNMSMTYDYDFGLFVKYLTSMTEEEFKAWALSDSFDCSQEWVNSSSSYVRTYLISKKYQAIVNYFKTELNIDLHAIGNAVAGS